MSPYFTRRSTDWRENLGAALVAAGVGAAVFYLARLVLSRQALLPDPPYTGHNIGEGESGADLPRLPSEVGGNGDDDDR